MGMTSRAQQLYPYRHANSFLSSHRYAIDVSPENLSNPDGGLHPRFDEVSAVVAPPDVVAPGMPTGLYANPNVVKSTNTSPAIANRTGRLRP